MNDDYTSGHVRGRHAEGRLVACELSEQSAPLKFPPRLRNPNSPSKKRLQKRHQLPPRQRPTWANRSSVSNLPPLALLPSTPSRPVVHHHAQQTPSLQHLLLRPQLPHQHPHNPPHLSPRPSPQKPASPPPSPAPQPPPQHPPAPASHGPNNPPSLHPTPPTTSTPTTKPSTPKSQKSPHKLA